MIEHKITIETDKNLTSWHTKVLLPNGEALADVSGVKFEISADSTSVWVKIYNPEIRVIEK